MWMRTNSDVGGVLTITAQHPIRAPIDWSAIDEMVMGGSRSRDTMHVPVWSADGRSLSYARIFACIEDLKW